MKCGEKLLRELEGKYTVTKEDIGEDANLSKSGVHFNVESYNVEDIGHLCVITMKAFLGLMRMETVVLSCDGKDMPLINFDWIGVLKNNTFLVEMYKSMLSESNGEFLDACIKIRDEDFYIPDYKRGKHWYEDLIMETSYRKTGGEYLERYEKAADDYISLFVKELDRVPSCNKEEKRAKNKLFADGILKNGAPVVNRIRKLFGEETAQKLVCKYMYGVD